MIGNLDIQKQQCLQTVVRGVLFKRCLETVRTVEEFKDFCARKRIDVPGFTENYRRQFNSLNQYAVREDFPLKFIEKSFKTEKPLESRPISDLPQSQQSCPSPNRNQFDQSRPTRREISNKLDQIRDLLKQEIGSEFAQFLRKLNYSDGYLQQLEYDCPRNLNEQIHRLVTRVITEAATDEVAIEKLCSTLKKIQRNDLVEKIRYIS